MRSSSPILLAFVGLVVAAVWYDTDVADAASASRATATAAAPATVFTRAAEAVARR
jgi:hypothetical protein